MTENESNIIEMLISKVRKRPDVYEWLLKYPKRDAITKLLAGTIALSTAHIIARLESDFELHRADEPDAPKEPCPKCNNTVYLYWGRVCSFCGFGLREFNEEMEAKRKKRRDNLLTTRQEAIIKWGAKRELFQES